MKLKIRMSVVKKIRFHYPEFEIDTINYPELEGKTLDEIRCFLQEHGDKLPAQDEEFDNLLQEMEMFSTTSVLNKYPEESRFYVKAEDEVNVEEEI